MDNKYNKAISQIKVDEKVKQELIQKLKQEKNKRWIFMTKIRKMFTTIGTLLGIAAIGGVAYAGLTGKINFFNNKIEEQYKNYEVEQNNKFVENQFSKITLDSIACDDAYLILNYTIDVKEAGKKQFEKIKLDTDSGFELELENIVKINGNKIEKIGSFSKQISYKITENQAKVYQLLDLTNKSVPDKFKLEISDLTWYGSDYNSHVEVEGKMSVIVSKKEAMQDTKTIIPLNSKYEYKDLEINVEKIVKTPFETFMIIKTKESNVTNKRFPVTRDDEVRDLNLKLFDENGKRIPIQLKTVAYLKYEDGTYYQDDEGNIINLSEGIPGGEDKFKNATIEGSIILTTGDKLDNLEKVKIQPYYQKFIDNGDYSEEYYTSLKWYPVKNEIVTAKDSEGAEVTVTKVEIKNDRILFYYTAKDLASEVRLFISNKKRAYNLFYTDIETKEIIPGEYMTGIRIKDYEGVFERAYEDGDTWETAKPSKYDYPTYLSDKENLIYTIDFGDKAMEELLGEGLIIQLK